METLASFWSYENPAVIMGTVIGAVVALWFIKEQF